MCSNRTQIQTELIQMQFFRAPNSGIEFKLEISVSCKHQTRFCLMISFHNLVEATLATSFTLNVHISNRWKMLFFFGSSVGILQSLS